MIRLRRIEPRHWRHLKKITRHGFVFEDSYRPGHYWGATLGGREKGGADSVAAVAAQLAWYPGKMHPDTIARLRERYDF